MSAGDERTEDDSNLGAETPSEPRREYPQHDELLSSLPQAFQDGFEELEAMDAVDPRIVTITDDGDPAGGNYVFISLGVVNVSKFADYDNDHAEVFVRLKNCFPAGQKYGFATDEVLRVDGNLPESSQTDRDHAEPLCDALGVEEVLYWSRRWDYLDIDDRDPSAMRNAVPWMRAVLSRPFEESE
ncbi:MULTISPECIES: hypothetical protein [Halorussus]|uniref:hypothetical protein n=1 Tax=Halorussus TaxID=1070314 RepID=UPI00209FE693|nr:hypothetical protein [Halorussus vallis]USZ78699.1 hypothetical protein NGM07_24625 [Halorussus vallis]